MIFRQGSGVRRNNSCFFLSKNLFYIHNHVHGASFRGIRTQQGSIMGSISRHGMPAVVTGLAICLGAAASTSAFAQGEASASDDVLEEIVVRGYRDSQAAARDIKRNSKNIVDAIVAEDIGKMPDENVAEALQRI
jgi:hypothetical protein